MDEQFDEKLKARITEVFDNYEFPPADEGWLELRKKFPVKEERKVAWLWWSSAAAILLVFLGVGLWLLNKPAAVDNVALTPKTQIAPKKDAASDTPALPDNTVASTPASLAKGNGDNAIESKKNGSPDKPSPTDNYTAANNTPVRPNNTAVITAPVTQNAPIKGLTTLQTPGTNAIAGNLPASKPGQVNVTDVSPAGQFPIDNKVNQPQIARIDVPANVTDNSQIAVANGKTSPVLTKQPAKTIDDLFKENKPQIAQQKADKKDLKKVNFSVYAATYINYAEGSANQVNAGAGFTSDIRLGKRVKLSTGISLAQNTLSYAGSPPATSVDSRAFAAAAAPDIKQSGSFSPAAAVAELQNYNASLVGLDIPINIKYEFNPEKSDTYISAGLSSGTFIDERYTYRYSYRNNNFANNTVTTQDQTSTQSFNSFYFGKTLNLSFGTGFPIGKTNRLVIEPFVKYPLGGMGTQAIHFGAGGVNLKFNFNAGKK